MQWSHHIDIVCNKASKALNFVRRNLSKCSTEVKSTTYLSLVRPIMEYAACVWDQYQKYLTKYIEKIQGRAARWVLSEHLVQMICSVNYNGLLYNDDTLQGYHSSTKLCTTAILLLSTYHLIFYLHHIQLDNYICIDASSHPFPPPATNKVSFLKQLSSGTV